MENLHWMAIALSIEQGGATPVQLCAKSGCTLAQAQSAMEQLRSSGVLSTHNCFCGENEPLAGGMTNHLVRFCMQGQDYLLRVPGEGTRSLLNRTQEAKVYAVLCGQGISDEVLFIDPCSGYKITQYLGNVRNCNPASRSDVETCMQLLKKVHAAELCVPHRFDVFERMDYYQTLCGSTALPYPDWQETRAAVYRLRDVLEGYPKEQTLCHIDPVHDNFLLDATTAHLIDWEYGAMCDPDIDVVMFCIYAAYSPAQLDETIDLYYSHACPPATRAKLYCYTAVCGLLWAYWCQYKKLAGVQYPQYQAAQYNYARHYGAIAAQQVL